MRFAAALMVLMGFSLAFAAPTNSGGTGGIAKCGAMVPDEFQADFKGNSWNEGLSYILVPASKGSTPGYNIYLENGEIYFLPMDSKDQRAQVKLGGTLTIFVQQRNGRLTRWESMNEFNGVGTASAETKKQDLEGAKLITLSKLNKTPDLKSNAEKAVTNAVTPMLPKINEGKMSPQLVLDTNLALAHCQLASWNRAGHRRNFEGTRKKLWEKYPFLKTHFKKGDKSVEAADASGGLQ